jgi:hypothetical protein
LFVTVASRNIPQDLMPASRHQDHTTSPSANTSLVLQRIQRPSHPALHVRDDAYAPPDECRTGEKLDVICPTAKAKIFSSKDWTAQISLKCFAKIVFWRTRRDSVEDPGDVGLRPKTDLSRA